jgi:TetR/AcrR family transcriptional repressor of multidrug resistance operon
MTKHRQILEAAEQLIAERGFYGLSMKELAKRAGMAAGTIYRYFENKEMLMFELHQFISTEASKTIFNGWLDNMTEEQKYRLLWNNAFNAVLNNPRRLVVFEMLYCTPHINQNTTTLFENETFSPLIEFYQKGVNEKRFHDWPIFALVALSFDSAISLAKKVLQDRLQIDTQIITQVRTASWNIIQQHNLTEHQ